MTLLDDVLKRDIRACARLLRYIDDGLPEARGLLKQLYPHAGRARVIGITGNPGAGKSTLMNSALVEPCIAARRVSGTLRFSASVALASRSSLVMTHLPEVM